MPNPNRQARYPRDLVKLLNENIDLDALVFDTDASGNPIVVDSKSGNTIAFYDRDTGEWNLSDINVQSLDADSVNTEELDNIADYVVGTTDELESAFNSLSDGEHIHIGAGSYQPSGTLTAGVEDVRITGMGLGEDGTVIEKTFDGDLIDLGGPDSSTRFKNPEIERLRLVGNNNTGRLLNLKWTTDIFIERVYWEHNAGVGVEVSSFRGLISMCESHDCHTNLLLSDENELTTVLNNLHFYDPDHTTPSGNHPIVDIVGGTNPSDGNTILNSQLENRSTNDSHLRIGGGRGNGILSQSRMASDTADPMMVVENVTDDPADVRISNSYIRSTGNQEYGLRVGGTVGGRVSVLGQTRAIGASTADLSLASGADAGFIGDQVDADAVEGGWLSGADVQEKIFANDEPVSFRDSAGNVRNILNVDTSDKVRIQDTNNNIRAQYFPSFGSVYYDDSGNIILKLGADGNDGRTEVLDTNGLRFQVTDGGNFLFYDAAGNKIARLNESDGNLILSGSLVENGSP